MLLFAGFALVSCARGEAKAPVAVAVADAPQDAPASRASSPVVPTAPVVVDTPDLSGLFIRVADALMPMGCTRRGQAAPDEDCLKLGANEPATLYPPMPGEAESVQATPEAIYMVLPDERQPGLLVPGGENDGSTGSDGPFVGFGVVGTRNPIRFTPVGLERVTTGVSSWCEKKRCLRGAGDELRKLYVRDEYSASVGAARLALKPLHAPATSKRPASRPAKSLSLYAFGHEEQLIVLPFDFGHRSGDGDDEFTFPGDFLVAQHGREFRHLIVTEGSTHGLGEAGDVLGVVDLDGDGTDELLLEWHAGEAYVYRFVRRVGDGLVVLGEYGFGC